MTRKEITTKEDLMKIIELFESIGITYWLDGGWGVDILCMPASASFTFVRSSTCAIAAMLESASPRKPREAIPVKSSTERILLVECLKKERGTSSFGIPHPLSAMRIREIPPSLISTVMAVAFASIAFSTSSFTIDAGRSITSPAAILSL